MLTGCNAIITGGSQGLGKAIAKAYVENGASVMLCARNGAILEETVRELKNHQVSKDQSINAVVADISVAEDVEALVRRARECMPHMDILVNDAGVHGPIGSIDTIDWEKWMHAVQINLFGTVNMIRHIIPLMKAQNKGKIINVSGGGATSPMPNFSAYAATKSAIVRLTETFAREYASYHIDINALAPGALNTRLLDEVLNAGPEATGSEYYQKALKQQQTGGASPERAAALCVYLASKQSDGITGRLISAVWDDWEHLHTHQEELAASDIYTLRRIIPQDRGENWDRP